LPSGTAASVFSRLSTERTGGHECRHPR